MLIMDGWGLLLLDLLFVNESWCSMVVDEAQYIGFKGHMVVRRLIEFVLECWC